MKRSEMRPNPERVREWLDKTRARSKGLSRQNGHLRRTGRPKRRTPDSVPPDARTAWDRAPRTRCVVCGDRATERHHVVKYQHCPPGMEWDPRNRIDLCRTHHERHHGIGSKRLRASLLPDAAFEFAGEVFGAGAYDYLRRHYLPDDPRVDDLLLLPIRHKHGKPTLDGIEH